jgi:YHS domain-containing protein
MGALLIRLLALLGLLWTGKQVVHQVSAALRPKQPEETRAADATESREMVKDPVCQTYVPKASAIQKIVHGETYYFCGAECAERFGQQ